MTTDQGTAVIERIRKLLALADGNQNEHERARAMETAMELLSRHNLTMSQITPAEAAACVEAVKAGFSLEPWARSVLLSAGKLYYTASYIKDDWEPTTWRKVSYPVFVGTAENIAVTMEMAAWLLASIRKESNRMYKSSPDRRSFRWGAANAVAERVEAMMSAEKRAAEETESTGVANSLMVMRNKLERANDDYLGTLNLKYSKPRTTYVIPDAYASGEEFGEEIHLQKRTPAGKGVAGLITMQ